MNVLGEGGVYTYDAADQLTDVKYDAINPDGSPSGWDREVTYSYDATGNRTGMVERIGSGKRGRIFAFCICLLAVPEFRPTTKA